MHARNTAQLHNIRSSNSAMPSSEITSATWTLLSTTVYFLKDKATPMHVRVHHKRPTFGLAPLPYTILIQIRHLLTMAESAGEMYALATVLTILAIVTTIMRFYARRIKQTALSWDDYAILPALVQYFQIIHIFLVVKMKGLISKQLFTISTAICMFVGKYRGIQTSTALF